MRTNFLIYEVRSAMCTNNRRYLCQIRDVYEVLKKVLCLILVCTKFAQKHAYETARNGNFGSDILPHMPGPTGRNFPEHEVAV
jgi:hypothetical protein